jgi:hypothetical protein
MTKRKAPAGDRKSRAERIVLWVGALCGIVVSLFTLYEKVTAPSPPKLSVTFFESSSNTLRLFPSTNTAIDQTEDIPLQLKIENTGGTAAKNTKLYVSHYLNVAMTAYYQKEEKRTWNSPNDAMKQLSLALENINPGESFLVPIRVILDFPKELQRAVRAPRESVVDKELLKPRAYPIYCDLSSDTSPNQRTILRIALGNLEVLKGESPDVFWLGHGEGGLQVLRVKDDFPSR